MSTLVLGGRDLALAVGADRDRLGAGLGGSPPARRSRSGRRGASSPTHGPGSGSRWPKVGGGDPASRLHELRRGALGIGARADHEWGLGIADAGLGDHDRLVDRGPACGQILDQLAGSLGTVAAAVGRGEDDRLRSGAIARGRRRARAGSRWRRRWSPRRGPRRSRDGRGRGSSAPTIRAASGSRCAASRPRRRSWNRTTDRRPRRPRSQRIARGRGRRPPRRRSSRAADRVRARRSIAPSAPPRRRRRWAWKPAPGAGSGSARTRT